MSGPHLIEGEPTVMLGSEHRSAAHVNTPHTGGGHIIAGSTTVFVGKEKLPFARKGDPTNDLYLVKEETQNNLFIGG
jgi:hypothetical protein